MKIYSIHSMTFADVGMLKERNVHEQVVYRGLSIS